LKTPMPTVSVIIVNYNSGTLLAESVNRVLDSTIPVEIFVSDNGSIDDSIKLLKNTLGDNSNINIIENNANLGFSQGNNKIIPLITSDYFLFLNPDCLIEPNTIERILETMTQSHNVGMVGCLILNNDGTEQPGCRRFIPTPWSAFFRVFRLSRFFLNNPSFHDFNLTGSPLPDTAVDVEAISGAFMLVSRTALDKVGLFDPGYFLHCEDLDWCLRFTQAGYRILFVPEIAITHIKGSCSINRPIFVEWHKHKGMLRFYRKFFLDKYPRSLVWLVTLGVYLRFGLIATYYSFLNLKKYFGVTRG
jgi:GT2 family glycosyltransferase